MGDMKHLESLQPGQGQASVDGGRYSAVGG